MNRTLTVQVTQDHISQGGVCSPKFCPVSLALQEKTGENWTVGATMAARYNTDYSKVLEFGYLPREVQEWIISFDSFDKNWPVRPFEFTVEVKSVEEDDD